MTHSRFARSLKLAFGASAGLSAMLLLGRLSGFAREVQLASVLGLSARADAAVILISFPDILVDLLLVGGLGAALMPEFSSRDRYRAERILKQALLAVAGAFGALALFIAAFPSFVTRSFAPGIEGATLLDLMEGVRLAAWAVPLTALAGVSTVFLNARQNFVFPAAGTLIFNLLVIAGLGLAPLGHDFLWTVAATVVVGAGIRLASQLFVVPVAVWTAPSNDLLIGGHIFRSLLSALIASSLMLLVPVVVRAAASTMAIGDVAAFNYATKLVELPFGVAIAAVATVAFPAVTQSLARNDVAGAVRRIADSIRHSVVISVSIAAPAIWFCDAFVEIIFGWTSVGQEGVARVTALARIALVGLPFRAVVSTTIVGLNAQRRTNAVLGSTLICSVSLPVLALPGMLFERVDWLVWATVGFYAILATTLSAVLRLPVIGRNGWMNARLLSALAAATGVFGICALTDGLWLVESSVLRSILGGTAILMAMMCGMRVSSPRSTSGVGAAS